MLDPYCPTFCSWGEYDRHQFLADCKLHGVLYPFGEDHLNIKKMFAQNLGLKKSYGMKKAMKILELQLEGTHHRGIDDARNIARIFRILSGASNR